MTEFQKYILHEQVRPLFSEMRVGLEKESQRVTLAGDLAKTDHPAALGNRQYHASIQTDFSETQMELITPVASSEKEVMNYLAALHEVSLRSMNPEEMLWPMSMPPQLPEDEGAIQIAKLDRFEEVLYRRYLAKSYGKRKQMVSGIHYNFEFSREFMQKLFEHQPLFTTMDELRTAVYMTVTRNFLRYRWFLTYLFGASPVAEKGYFEEDEIVPSKPVRSIRNSEYGYRNHKGVTVSYASIEAYVAGIKRLVELGILSEEKEFYAPIRLRGGKKVADLKQMGVHYIEVRNLDIDPFAPYGIKEETVRFIQLFMMYLLWVGNEQIPTELLVETGEQLNNQVALEDPETITSMQKEGLRLIKEIRIMAQELNLSDADLTLISQAEEKLYQPEKTLSAQMIAYQKKGLSNRALGVQQGRAFKEKAYEKPYQLAGFKQMELSTQILLFDAMQKGLEVTVLDEQDQFIKLKQQQHVEYVKNANMTSQDTYITPLIMENKTVTKKILAAAGFQVPAGKEYQTVQAAEQAYDYFKAKGIVIKPKSTNYGIGISIFKEGVSKEDYLTGVRLALKEDQTILIEEYLTGTEYRFFVLDNQVKAILLRIPANVQGDGKHTIRELVIAKNQDSLRGTNHRAPLEKIELGEVEELMLKEQGYTWESIPKAKEIVYLRENSNISTGGDSLDVTDEFDDSYKQIAVEAVQVLGAKICGIDLIIPDKEIPATKNSEQYGIIEANFNPAMHMHVYPFAGQGRRLTKDVLHLLYPEIG